MFSIPNNFRTFSREMLNVKVFSTTGEMGRAAAAEVAAKIVELLGKKEEVNMIFAAAPSQEAFLNSLIADSRIDWTRINAFHMDEYIGVGPSAPQSFAHFLRERIFDRVPFRAVYCLDGLASDRDAECARYAGLLQRYPVDIDCMGIGENGHIAFNDPDVADFNDPKLVKVVALDPVCRQQQVNEKCFERLDLVPSEALTLTVPALLRGRWLFCIVPFASKAEAVRCTLYGEISEHCPASVLRNEADACLYLTAESARLLPAE